MLRLLVLCAALVSISAFSADATKPEVKWNGDFRFRDEFVSQGDVAPTVKSSYNQQRIRARLGAMASVAEGTDVEFRLATAPGRVSTNQTLTGGFSNYTLTLDRANFKSKLFDSLTIVGGRAGSVYFQPGDSDLLWDADLNFDGLAASFTNSMGDFEPFVKMTYYSLTKSTSTSPLAGDVTLSSAQIGVKHKLSDDTTWAAGVALHHFDHLQNQALIATPASLSANTAIGGTYAYEYQLLNPGAEFRTNVGGHALTVMAEYVKNSGTTLDNTGYLAGFKLGKLKQAGDFAFGYDYRKLGADATVAAFTDGDSFGGVGTNGRSHRVAVTYLVADAVTAGVTGFIGEAGLLAGQTAARRNKFHADLVFKF